MNLLEHYILEVKEEKNKKYTWCKMCISICKSKLLK